jgi:hypothetical protein
MEEDIKTNDYTKTQMMNEPINITLPFKWNDEVHFMDNNQAHSGKIIGFSCHGQFDGVFVTSYDIAETAGDFGRQIEIDSDFVFSTKEELIKKVIGTI